MVNPEFYETIRRFRSFDDFLKVTSLITESYDAVLRAIYTGVGADVHSIEDVIQGPAQIWSQLNDASTDRLNVPFSWDYKLRLPGPVMYIKCKEYGKYIYQFQSHGAGDEETMLLYAVATALFHANKIKEVKK